MSQEFKPQIPTVYGREGCVQCQYTQKELNRLHIQYAYIDITLDIAAEEQIKDMGFNSLPVVVTNDDKWFGFRPDRIRSLSNDT